MMLIIWEKQPTERKDYDILMERFLKPSDDEIVRVVARVRSKADDPNPLEVDTPQYTKDRVKLWISGGTTGHTYVVEVDVHTALGRMDQSELTFKVKEI